MVDPRAKLEQKRQYKAARTGRQPKGDALRAKKEGSVVGKAKRVMHENVLYLMVVNMPSEQEMAAAAEVMERARGGGLGEWVKGMMGGS